MTTLADTQAVILVDPEIDPDHLIMDTILCRPDKEPIYSVGEVAKFFFAKSAHWVRWQEDRGFFTLGGKKVGIRRTESDGPITQRRYKLDDIELMAYALAEKGALPADDLRATLRLVREEARLWGYFTLPTEDDE